MTQSPRWFFHPVLIFTGSILALVASLFLYIYWYIEISSGLDRLMERFDLESSQILTAETWIVILVLSTLVGIILLGIFIIFVYSQKTLRLYRLQNNFINNFTHELKTPVTSLRLYLETFQKHALPRESQLKYIDYMIQDAAWLNTTINSMLELARIESKSYAGNFVLKDLREAVGDFLAGNAHLIRNCRITTVPAEAEPADRAFFCQIDPVMFDMLLMNLVTNAIRYTRSDRPALTLRLTAERRRILLILEDNGIGIDKRECRRIFRKFYQVGQADDMTARGSGIGLYLSQNIARLHGGRLTARSEGLGKGSRFILSLPDKYPMQGLAEETP